ncbi:MAG: MarR family transcriptional regulator [Spirochaetales bacterium]|nr:MarR family transcriptional regulator [Spirochaetales bacterium]
MATDFGENNPIYNYIRAQKFYFLTEQCLNLIKKSLNPLLKDYGLNHSQYLILVVLGYAGMKDYTVISTEISYLMGLEKHSITSLIDSLCKHGYVKRERSEEDRRVIFLSLTPSGQSLIEKVQPRTIETISVFPECTDEEFDKITTFLNDLLKLAAQKNNQKPDLYQRAYKKLLIDGEEEFLKRYNEQDREVSKRED